MRSATERIVCDPADAYLDDHRPGGHPLLGTVAKLELMARVATRRCGGRPVTTVTDLGVFAPMIFADERPREASITVHWREDGDDVRGELASDDAEGREVSHASCTFHYGAPPGGRPPEDLPPLEGRVVDADEIYACYFHGPAFRVLDRAARIGDAVVSRSATNLPGWARDTAPDAIAPRVVEFALQTAGLLQLALDGAMMIPKHIDAIARHSAADLTGPTPLRARATRVGAGIDIEVVDAAGDLVVRIDGYRCEPLPFAQDEAKPRRLAQQINATRDEG